jgi:hypothetical protein
MGEEERWELSRLCENRNERRPVRAFIRQDRRLTIWMITDERNINECKVHQIVAQDLSMRTMWAKMVP